MTNLTEFERAYIACALWSSTDENDEPMDASYDTDDLAPEAVESMIADCQDFQRLAGNVLAVQSDEQNGHLKDFGTVSFTFDTTFFLDFCLPP